MDAKKILAFFSLLVLCSVNVMAEGLFPDDSPCRWDGNLLFSNGSTADFLTIDAFVNTVYQKNTSLNGSSAYTLTLAGHENDNVTFSVCGLLVGEDVFEEFESLALNLTVPLQEDGTRGCTCDGVCGGSHCVNPGETGVCSSAAFFCDSDSVCEADFGETTDTCSADCPVAAPEPAPAPSGGGGGGGGGGGSRTARRAVVNTTPSVEVEEAPVEPQAVETATPEPETSEESSESSGGSESSGTESGDTSPLSGEVVADVEQSSPWVAAGVAAGVIALIGGVWVFFPRTPKIPI